MKADVKMGEYDELSKIKGADMILYGLYTDNIGHDKDLSMEYAVLFLSRIDSSAVSIYIAELYDRIADYYELDRFQYSKSILYKKKALDQYRRLENDYKAASCGYGLAKLFLKKGSYHLALEYAMKELRYFQRNPEYGAELMECYKLLGVIYQMCGDFQESERYFSEYAKSARVENDSLRFMVGLNNSAVFANSLGDTVKTIRLLNESLSISKEINDTVSMCKLYLNAAAASTESGDYLRAVGYLKESSKLLVDIELNGLYWYNKGYLQLMLQDTLGALDAYEKSVLYYSQGEFDQVLRELYSSMNTLYGELGDTSKAYHYLSSLYQLDNIASEDDMWRKLFMVQKGIQQEQASEVIKRQKISQKIVILCSSFVVVISIMVVTVLLRKRKYEVKQRLAESKRFNELSEERRTRQFRSDKIVENAIGKLTHLASDVQNASLRSSIMKICNELRESKDSESWKELEQFVPDFNSDFFQNLIREYPSLSINESRICILLNKNLSTKQISEITRQTPESINVARTRLRKKLGIDGQKVSIQEFLRQFN